VLDVAGGTGDISFRLHTKAKEEGLPLEITVSDINGSMLDVGKRRAIELGIFKDLKFMELNAEDLS